VSRNRAIKIYGEKNPGDIPVYSISEAARYLRLPIATVRSWVIGRQAGDSIVLLAEDYRRDVAEIGEAIRYEGRIAS
jgi:hypothetical protein